VQLSGFIVPIVVPVVASRSIVVRWRRSRGRRV